nr:hypothetical protein BaRGS_024353 [Batillaria attramentaria]
MSNLTSTESVLEDARNQLVGKPLCEGVRVTVVTLGWLACVIGVFGNVLIITTLLSQQALRSVHNIYIANLALADLLVVGYTLPFWLLDLNLGYQPVANMRHCKVNSFILGVSLILVFVLSVVSGMPVGLALAADFVSDVDVSSEAYAFLLLLVFLNNSVNWIVYGVMNKSFKEGYKQLMLYSQRSSNTLRESMPPKGKRSKRGNELEVDLLRGLDGDLQAVLIQEKFGTEAAVLAMTESDLLSLDLKVGDRAVLRSVVRQFQAENGGKGREGAYMPNAKCQ